MDGAGYCCDIIVVTWNKLDYIKECVEAILKHTDVKSRLLIVDNASEEDTRSYLKGLGGNGPVDIKVLFNDRNLGPGKARNIALKGVDADYICFVDSDVTVTPGWLSAMTVLAKAHPEIGMINPSSNNFNQFPPAGVSLDEYALSLNPFKGGYIEVGQCISFCMLMKREVMERIGFFDEGYLLALYEDTDYSMKAGAAGYRCVIARDSYVWHHGHGSTGRVKRIDEIAKKNEALFYKKWGRPLRIMRCFRWPSGDGVERETVIGCIKLARDGNFVYLFIHSSPFKTAEELFKAHSLIEHANVHIIFHKGIGFNWFCLWRLLKRRKKGYDLAIADDGKIVSLMKRFKFFYKAQVLAPLNFDEVLRKVQDLKW